MRFAKHFRVRALSSSYIKIWRMYHLVVNLIQETFISNKVVFVKSSKKISILLINMNYSPDTNLYDEQHQFINITCVYVQILLDRYCKWKQ